MINERGVAASTNHIICDLLKKEKKKTQKYVMNILLFLFGIIVYLRAHVYRLILLS